MLAFCVVRYGWMRLRGPMPLERRARWLQATTRGILAGLGINFEVDGQLPGCGLIVSNHLSYLDILLISAATPCFFVAKSEIGHWPFFGWAARRGGTIFLKRASMASANAAAGEIYDRLALSVPVLLFPEGTSTDGAQVLRFHSRLIAPAVAAGAPITAAAIRYEIEGGEAERELCWYGDATLLPHLWKALGGSGFTARIHFGEPRIYADRREAADRTHAEITAWREAGKPALEMVGAAD
jgi:1-acyl-sn-glycerol-3-phosphate acyltransferase